MGIVTKGNYIMNKIGIIGAMELEIETLKNNMQVENIVTKASMAFYEGTLNNTKVVVVKSGVAKVNAGICAQVLVDLFHVTHIINTGVAGSLLSDINIGDIVLSTDACYHDVDATIFGYEPGEVPQLGTFSFKANEHLIELAQTSCGIVNPDIQVFKGRVVSGDQFVCDKKVKQHISEIFKGYCTEMEGAAIAQVSYLNDIPFLIIRAISDKADDSAQMDYPSFEKEAAIHSAKLVEHLVSKL